ncbi:MAG: hypothetical protein CVT60_04980 [Actinobacteria bacterium HGW-Actinobacteria-10]|jgi:hypothetical protein|nr:MAG: hypothetical protein CVT60_04980 [Actinobacteria bacterium HGW-Actinobacteria-10]
MPQCSYHPDVETWVSCGECGRYICPKDMKSTPVGYKCPECARPAKGQYTYVKPRQAVYGALAGLATATVGAWLLVASGVGFFLIGVVWGMLVGEAVRRGAGGHRGPTAATIGVMCVLIGGLIGGLDLLAVAMGVAGVISTLSWSWGR